MECTITYDVFKFCHMYNKFDELKCPMWYTGLGAMPLILLISLQWTNPQIWSLLSYLNALKPLLLHPKKKKKLFILLQITLTLSRHSIADYICSVAFIPVCKTGILSPFLHTHHFYTLSFSVSHVFMYCYWWCEARYIIRVRLWPMILCMIASWYCLTVLCMMRISSMHAVVHILWLFQLNCILSSLLSLQWQYHIV